MDRLRLLRDRAAAPAPGRRRGGEGRCGAAHLRGDLPRRPRDRQSRVPPTRPAPVRTPGRGGTAWCATSPCRRSASWPSLTATPASAGKRYGEAQVLRVLAGDHGHPEAAGEAVGPRVRKRNRYLRLPAGLLAVPRLELEPQSRGG